MKYTIKQFQGEFPNDDVCLDYIFNKKYGVTGYYRIKGRKSYANAQGEQLHPLKDTIFEKSSTPLTLWLYAIFLVSQSKNGVSAKELQRQLGVTYKCAWRIANRIRSLMADDSTLGGIVEVDETYVGGKAKNSTNRKTTKKDKAVLFGAVERGGRINVKHIVKPSSKAFLQEIQIGVKSESTVYSDGYKAYKNLSKRGYKHDSVSHMRNEWVRGDVHTNTIEGFWSQLKRSLSGTYHCVSKKYLQNYADEFAFRYSVRKSPVHPFHLLMERV